MMGRNTSTLPTPAEYAVDDQAVDHRVDAVGREAPVHQGGQGVHAHGQPVATAAGR